MSQPDYPKLIRAALTDLRKHVPDLGQLNVKVLTPKVLPPMGGEDWVEVLFVVGKDKCEPMTAYFQQGDDPGSPVLVDGW